MIVSRPIRDPIRSRASRARRARVGLVALCMSALMGTGCSSLGLGGGNGCGGGCGLSKCGLGGGGGLFGSGGLSQKLFHKRGTAVATDSCEGSLGAMSVDSGDPGSMTPGPVITAPAPTPTDSDPSLLPLPKESNSSGSPPAGSGSQGSNTGTVKSMYQTRQDRTRGEAQEARRDAGSSRSSRGSASGHPAEASSIDPLANLPGVLGEGDSLTPGSSPPSPPTAGDRPPVGEGAVAPDPALRTPVGMAPGIQRFHVIEPRIAAGSLPSESGWKWLVEKGYRTVLDLRDTSEIGQQDLANIAHHGLRLVSLPTSKTSIETLNVKRFEEELARADLRPVFIFDADGTRPASLAYLHLVLAKKLDRRAAEREVEELGASDTALWHSALAYLNSQPRPTAEVLPIGRSETDASAAITAESSPIVASIETSPSPSEPVIDLVRSALSLGEKALANLSAAAIGSQLAPAESGD